MFINGVLIGLFVGLGVALVIQVFWLAKWREQEERIRAIVKYQPIIYGYGEPY
jgi:hypothetical protein